MAKTVAETDRESLLVPNIQRKTQSARVPLVVTWSHRFHGISQLLHANYARATASQSSFKDVFPEPPILSFRRAKNLKDTLVRARCWKKSTTHPVSRASIAKNLNSQPITVGNKSFNVLDSSPNSKNVIYCAECTSCDKIYVGSTGNTLQVRFRGHKSDIKCYPDRCELPGHFAESPGCDFRRDLRLSVLETTTANESQRLEREEIWIQRLSCLSPHRLMNSKSTEIAAMHKILHRTWVHYLLSFIVLYYVTFPSFIFRDLYGCFTFII